MYKYSATTANNTVGGADVSEGCSPGNVNDALRGFAQEAAKWRDDLGGKNTTGGTANAQTLTTSSTLTALADGVVVSARAGYTNGGAMTLDVNGLGAQDVKRYLADAGIVALAGGEVTAGGIYHFAWKADTSDWIVLNPSDAGVSFSAHKNGTDQTPITSGVATKITFDTEDFDIGGYFNTTNSRFTPPAGKYRLSGTALFAATNMAGGASLIVYIYKNGAEFARTQIQTSSTGAQGATVTRTVAASGTDYFEFYASCAAPGGKTVLGAAEQTYFSGERI